MKPAAETTESNGDSVTKVLMHRNAELQRRLAKAETGPRRGPAILGRRRRVGAEDVRKFYANAVRRPAGKAPLLGIEAFTLTNTATGLGDCVVLTDLPRQAFASGREATAYHTSVHWSELSMCVPHLDVCRQMPLQVSVSQAMTTWDLGGGHTIQRIQRLFGVPVDPAPRGNLWPGPVRRVPGRVSLHFGAGPHQQWQRKQLHPRAREVYPPNLEVIRELIRERADLEWIEVGTAAWLNEARVQNACGRGLTETIRLMAECEFHIGIVSGPMHLAQALGVKVIAIVNFPHPGQLMLPSLVPTGIVEEEWLYPTQVVLHQDEDSAHWPRFSRKTLEAALNGEVYPYWSGEVACELAEE